MKVYVVVERVVFEDGYTADYADYVNSVFSTKEKAEAYIEKKKSEELDFRAFIVERELDKETNIWD